jgi:hypothetical protein
MKLIIFFFILALLAGCASREETEKPEKTEVTQAAEIDADLPCGCAGAPVNW